MPLIRAGLVAACLLAAAALAMVAVRLCRPGGRIASLLATLFCRAMLRLLRIRLEVSGAVPDEHAGRLLVANHVSWIDPLVLLAVTPASVLAKREVCTWPVIGALARLQATIPIDRKRRREIPGANRAMAERLDQSRNVLLFPEGTTHDGTRRGRFLTSHLGSVADAFRRDPDRASVPVQAVALAYSDREAAWIGDDTLLPHLWTVLRRPGMTCRLAFAAPLDIARGADRKVLGRELAHQIEGLLTTPAPLRSPPLAREPDPHEGLIVTHA